jgi:hypothetical protein
MVQIKLMWDHPARIEGMSGLATIDTPFTPEGGPTENMPQCGRTRGIAVSTGLAQDVALLDELRGTQSMWVARDLQGDNLPVNEMNIGETARQENMWTYQRDRPSLWL